MSRLDPAIGRRRERVVGAVIVVVGVAVLVLSIVALVAAGSGASSDVSGPKVTLPGGSRTPSATGSPSGTVTGSPTGSPTGSGSAGTSTSASSSASSSTSSSTSNSPAGAGSQPLVVLNNTSQTGLAQQAANTFEQGGWTVTSTGNWSTSTLSTCAYYDPDVAGAQAAAEALMQQFPAIQRTAEKYGGLPAGPVVVVLTGGI